MTTPTTPLNVGLYITRDPSHKTARKTRIHAPGFGTIWVREDEDAEAMATKWIAAQRGWPEHLVNAYNLNAEAQ